MQYTVNRTQTIYLGKQGEHLARTLAFPEVTAWEQALGPGRAELLYLPHGVKKPISIALERTGRGEWLWTVTAVDTANVGHGHCELRYVVGDVLAKSADYTTYVAPGLAGRGMADTYIFATDEEVEQALDEIFGAN